MYNRGLTITTKVDVAMCLIKPMTRGTMKRISEPVESNESESGSDFDMSEPEETNDADEDHDYVPRPVKKFCCNLAHSSIGSNDKSAMMLMMLPCLPRKFVLPWLHQALDPMTSQQI